MCVHVSFAQMQTHTGYTNGTYTYAHARSDHPESNHFDSRVLSFFTVPLYAFHKIQSRNYPHKSHITFLRSVGRCHSVVLSILPMQHFCHGEFACFCFFFISHPIYVFSAAGLYFAWNFSRLHINIKNTHMFAHRETNALVRTVCMLSSSNE